MYCVYLTTYSGDKMPPLYIGSSSVNYVEKGYRGSVKSKNFRDIWKKELKENFHLFSVEILSLHQTREEATKEENRIQHERDILKHPNLYINRAFAAPNGCMGAKLEPWNKGLSKQTDTRLATYSQSCMGRNVGITKEINPNLASNRKGKTKNNDASLARLAETKNVLSPEQKQILVDLKENKGFCNKQIQSYFVDLGVEISYSTISTIYQRIGKYEKKKKPIWSNELISEIIEMRSNNMMIKDIYEIVIAKGVNVSYSGFSAKLNKNNPRNFLCI